MVKGKTFCEVQSRGDLIESLTTASRCSKKGLKTYDEDTKTPCEVQCKGALVESLTTAS